VIEGAYEPSPWDWVREQVEAYERTERTIPVFVAARR
jgi:hypothetical protein